MSRFGHKVYTHVPSFYVGIDWLVLVHVYFADKEEQERDLILRLASESGSKSNNNKCGIKGWKGRLIMATV